MWEGLRRALKVAERRVDGGGDPKLRSTYVLSGR